MKVTHYTDLANIQFREIISDNYNSIKDLEREYNKKGNKTWINIYNRCQGLWMLTIKITGGK